jgi:hypothetical protein
MQSTKTERIFTPASSCRRPLRMKMISTVHIGAQSLPAKAINKKTDVVVAVAPDSEMFSGTIKTWNASRGFG